MLLDLYRDAKKRLGDPVLAWRDVVEDPAKAAKYKTARGKGGMVRLGWGEAAEIIAAGSRLHDQAVRAGPPRGLLGDPRDVDDQLRRGLALLRTARRHDAVVLRLVCGPPDGLPAGELGDQTDVPESGDWFNSGYLVMWGSNIPLTRTPDAHFMTEARYHGQKVVACSGPARQQDEARRTSGSGWLPVRTGHSPWRWAT